MKLSGIKRYLAITAIITTAFLACKSNNNTVPTYPFPKMKDSGIKDGKDTINVGQTLQLYPKLESTAGMTYMWIVNSRKASVDSAYNFTPPSAGNYRVTYKAFNTAGELAYDYQINVK
ncbi:PKD domain-containing protein [Chitinophaga pendula]|uniref:PKD-like domain-containing protein n=1 Tax=Chitinophaga TaxID=79328 RepID=UPI000BAF4064|nr:MULTISPECIES: PKD-like domain-containing protein [Chitinophaga]ASZ10713.1 hypothetical protein CK934_06835 [Chitinophaga sp. MD30]UCJ06312.1 PKD domain-containing protein [Chitinophaga pendula]